MAKPEQVEQLNNIFTGKTVKAIQPDAATGTVEVFFTDGTNIAFNDVVDWRGGEASQVRAAMVAKAAKRAVIEYRRKQALDYTPEAQALPSGMERYPEFKPLVTEIVRMVVQKINADARKIDSKMPYKAQFTLEEVIKELQDRV